MSECERVGGGGKGGRDDTFVNEWGLDLSLDWKFKNVSAAAEGETDSFVSVRREVDKPCERSANAAFTTVRVESRAMDGC